MIVSNIQVRPATPSDQPQIASLIHSGKYVHRHLDWRNPLEWIGTPPFYILENQGEILATLGCPPDPPTVAWIRLFVNSGQIPVQEAWQRLWETVRMDIPRGRHSTAAAIVLHEWLGQLLGTTGFTSHQAIVMLERDADAPNRKTLPQESSLRAMLPYDLPAVAEVDRSSFAMLWQNSLPALERAYPQAIWATVAEQEGQIVGYQLSTRNQMGVHLARLAVLPSFQRHGVGYALVADLIQKAVQHGITHLTVNTQSDNATSLALYQSLGFHQTDNRYPVYQLEISE